ALPELTDCVLGLHAVDHRPHAGVVCAGHMQHQLLSRICHHCLVRDGAGAQANGTVTGPLPLAEGVGGRRWAEWVDDVHTAQARLNVIDVPVHDLDLDVPVGGHTGSAPSHTESDQPAEVRLSCRVRTGAGPDH